MDTDETVRHFAERQEVTTRLHICIYTDPALNRIGPEIQASPNGIASDVEEFLAYADQLSANGTRRPNATVTYQGGYHLLLQQNALHPHTFSSALPLPNMVYTQLMEAMHFPFKASESWNCSTGQLFWAGMRPSAGGKGATFHVIMRKVEPTTNGRHGGSYAGWEALLSHNMDTGTTLGFCRGKRNGELTSLDKSITTLQEERSAPDQLCHPMLLPMVIFSHEIDNSVMETQNDAVHELDMLTSDINLFWRQKLHAPGKLTGLEIAGFHGRIVDCHNQTLRTQPARYLEIVNSMHDALLAFYEGLDVGRKRFLVNAQVELVGRAKFYQAKLKVLRGSVDATAAKLKTQRELLQALIALDVSIYQERQQRMDKEDSDRASAGQTLLALMGVFFLPASLIAGIFSTTFFDFRDPLIVSDNFWIYWMVTLPLTLLVLGSWFFYKVSQDAKAHKARQEERRRTRKFVRGRVH